MIKVFIKQRTINCKFDESREIFTSESPYKYKIFWSLFAILALEIYLPKYGASVITVKCYLTSDLHTH